MTCDFVNILFVIYAIQRIQQNHRAVIYIFIMAAMIITAVMQKGVVAEIPLYFYPNQPNQLNKYKEGKIILISTFNILAIFHRL